MVSSIHTPIVIQNNFKGNDPPYIENIQRDMRISVEKAKNIVLMGYTLPKDDIIYRSMFVSKNNNGLGHSCSVIVGCDENFPNKWLEGEELQKYIDEHKYDKDDSKRDFILAAESAISIFGKENVRVYGRGLPDVFMKNGRVDEERVKDIISDWRNN